ncbi:MAG: bifunctional demethylmenaquinone methyltransferase/2-methoxy-6-polyprenyl-1,4-benzoquinol methylase UbiE [Trueperaceae bacterium]
MNAVRPDADAVQQMFSDIAFRYDALNRLLSCGIDTLWRRDVVREVVAAKPQHILDVATGTADLAIALKQALSHAEVIGVDFAEPMLEVGREKVSKRNLSLPLLQGDGLNLKYPDNSFDALTIAYGIRNFSDRQRGLEEFYRVLKPGGTLAILEFPPPPEHLFGKLFRFYFLRVSPYIAGMISGRRDAYVYLGHSVLNFPTPEVFAAMMQKAGFSNVRYKLQTFGVSALHIGVKP